MAERWKPSWMDRFRRYHSANYYNANIDGIDGRPKQHCPQAAYECCVNHKKRGLDCNQSYANHHPAKVQGKPLPNKPENSTYKCPICPYESKEKYVDLLGHCYEKHIDNFELTCTQSYHCCNEVLLFYHNKSACGRWTIDTKERPWTKDYERSLGWSKWVDTSTGKPLLHCTKSKCQTHKDRGFPECEQAYIDSHPGKVSGKSLPNLPFNTSFKCPECEYEDGDYVGLLGHCVEKHIKTFELECPQKKDACNHAVQFYRKNSHKYEHISTPPVSKTPTKRPRSENYQGQLDGNRNTNEQPDRHSQIGSGMVTNTFLFDISLREGGI